MKIAGENFKVLEYFGVNSSVPDCIVKGPNKIGSGNGEAKFYISNKDIMRNFYGGEGFSAEVIMLKSDLLSYMAAIKNEYLHPTYPYGEKYNAKRKTSVPLSSLWEKRFEKVCNLPDVITFKIHDQTQILGPRGYINSDDKYYEIIREIALPESSYISACQLLSPQGNTIFYWKLFVDYVRLNDPNYKPLSMTYGKASSQDDNQPLVKETPSNETEKQKSRVGQGKYRDDLLNQMPFCPITGISDERLLIASHIKPWASSTDQEKVDPFNGYMLSPMFDKLFDKGFITFTEDKRVHLSSKISPRNYKIINIEENQYFQNLLMDERRIRYLEFHRKNVFVDFASFS